MRESKIDRIRVLTFDNVDQVSLEAAKFMLELMSKMEGGGMTLATGNTMLSVYRELARLAAAGNVDLSDIGRLTQLDEYWPTGLDEEHSFGKYLYDNFYDPLNISEDQIEVMDGLAQDPYAEANRYDQLVTDVRIAVLGIGPGGDPESPGGHVGFNEPGTPFDKRTHFTELSKGTTSRDKARGTGAPENAITQGPANITEAENIVFIAHGASKAELVAAALLADVSPQVPATVLRLMEEGKVTFFLDEAAAAQLP